MQIYLNMLLDNKCLMPLVNKNKNKNDDYEEDDERSTSNFVPVKKANKKPVLEYNNRTELSYVEQGLTPPALDHQEKNFLSKVDPKIEPVTRSVSKIVRLKAIDYNSPKRERKEFLYYYENWTGRDWLKRTVPPVTDHVEGKYDMILTEPVYDTKEEQLIGYKRSGTRQVYYIPFSKSKVDEIIDKSMGTDKDTIKFLFMDGDLGFEFDYEHFVNLSYEELANLLVVPGGPGAVLRKEKLEEWQKQQDKQKHQQSKQ